MGVLYLISTPIGNRDDITLRALRLLGEVRLIACEDTRHSGRLLAHYGITTPTISYHAHNERQRQALLLERLAEGDVALISDAGTPTLSDPGYLLVQAAIGAGWPVVAVPGASALLAATTASGMVPEGFTFLGFLPRRAAEARRRLRPLAGLPHPLVLYEAPHRLAATVQLLLEELGDRPVAAARELTKRFEEIERGRLSELLASLSARPARGEYVLVIGPAEAGASAALAAEAATPAGRLDPEALVEAMIATGESPSQAARRVARATGAGRGSLYALALRLSRQRAAATTAESTPDETDG